MNEPESVDPDAQMDQRYVDLKLTEQIDVLLPGAQPDKRAPARGRFLPDSFPFIPTG
jgi:hypothetical protein